MTQQHKPRCLSTRSVLLNHLHSFWRSYLLILNAASNYNKSPPTEFCLIEKSHLEHRDLDNCILMHFTLWYLWYYGHHPYTLWTFNGLAARSPLPMKDQTLKPHHFYNSLLCQNSPWILTGLPLAAPCRHLWVPHGSEHFKQHQCTISQKEGTKAAQTNTANQRQQIWYVYLEHTVAKDKLIVSQESMIEARKNHLAQCRGRRKRKEQEFRM